MHFILTYISKSKDNFMKANHYVLLLKASCFNLDEDNRLQPPLSLSPCNKHVFYKLTLMINLPVSLTISQSMWVQDQTGWGQFANQSAAVGTEDTH